jgi:hypothetical protein
MLKEGFRDKPLLSSWDALLDWLRADLGPLDVERVRVLYLNARNMLIRDELASEASIDQSAIYVREAPWPIPSGWPPRYTAHCSTHSSIGSRICGAGSLRMVSAISCWGSMS